jgi:hypothetical protein
MWFTATPSSPSLNSRQCHVNDARGPVSTRSSGAEKDESGDVLAAPCIRSRVRRCRSPTRPHHLVPICDGSGGVKAGGVRTRRRRVRNPTLHRTGAAGIVLHVAAASRGRSRTSVCESLHGHEQAVHYVEAPDYKLHRVATVVRLSGLVLRLDRNSRRERPHAFMAVLRGAWNDLAHAAVGDMVASQAAAREEFTGGAGRRITNVAMDRPGGTRPCDSKTWPGAGPASERWSVIPRKRWLCSDDSSGNHELRQLAS